MKLFRLKAARLITRVFFQPDITENKLDFLTENEQILKSLLTNRPNCLLKVTVFGSNIESGRIVDSI